MLKYKIHIVIPFFKNHFDFVPQKIYQYYCAKEKNVKEDFHCNIVTKTSLWAPKDLDF